MSYTEYETTVIMRPDISGEVIESVLSKFRGTVDSQGKVIAINHWGKKRLAYAIAKNTRGVYVHAKYLGAGALVSEVERDFRLSENVLRFLTVKLEDNIDAADRESVAYVAPEYDAPEMDGAEGIEAASADDNPVADRNDSDAADQTEEENNHG